MERGRGRGRRRAQQSGHPSEVSISQQERGLGEGPGQQERVHFAGSVPRAGGRVHGPVPAGPGGAHHHPPVQGALLLLSQELLVLQLRTDLCAQWPHLPLPRLPVDGWLRDPGTPGGYRQALATPAHTVQPLAPAQPPWAPKQPDASSTGMPGNTCHPHTSPSVSAILLGPARDRSLEEPK